MALLRCVEAASQQTMCGKEELFTVNNANRNFNSSIYYISSCCTMFEVENERVGCHGNCTPTHTGGYIWELKMIFCRLRWCWMTTFNVRNRYQNKALYIQNMKLPWKFDSQVGVKSNTHKCLIYTYQNYSLEGVSSASHTFELISRWEIY